MKLTKPMCKLIADLEYIIGSQCYNPNSYDGWNLVEGCEFRYPVTVRFKNADGEINEDKFRSNLNNKWINQTLLKPDSIQHLYYKFGSNHLYIGTGIITMLEELEKRYNIDFNELEKQRNKSKKD